MIALGFTSGDAKLALLFKKILTVGRHAKTDVQKCRPSMYQLVKPLDMEIRSSDILTISYPL